MSMMGVLPTANDLAQVLKEMGRHLGVDDIEARNAEAWCAGEYDLRDSPQTFVAGDPITCEDELGSTVPLGAAPLSRSQNSPCHAGNLER